MDRLSKEKRSWNMSKIRSKNTRPELLVRSFLHSKGYRYRLHVKKLPGIPDIVLSKYKTAIFVHGCFWHRHPGCKFSYKPKSNIDFWNLKFDKNIKRHEIVFENLKNLGWKVLVIWECETKNEPLLEQKIISHFN